MAVENISTPRTFRDLYIDLLNKTREDTSHTATVEQAKRYINQANYELHMDHGEKLPWALREGLITTKAEYGNGSSDANVTSIGTGSTGFILSSSPGTDDLNRTIFRYNGLVKIAGSSEVYRVASVSGTTITLATQYIGEDATSAALLYFEDQYALPQDFGRPVSFTNFDDRHEIQLIGRGEFRRRFPQNNVTGKPRLATIVEQGPSATGGQGQIGIPISKWVRFSPAPSAISHIPYTYVTRNYAYSGQATGYIYYLTMPANNETITIGSETWTFKTSGASTNETNLQSTIEATLDQLVSDLNASSNATINNFTYSRENMPGHLAGLTNEYQKLYYPALRVDSDTIGAIDDSTTLSTDTLLAGDVTMQSFRPQQNMVGDYDEPIVPWQMRDVIVDLALYRWYLHRKDDARAAQAREDADSKISRVIANNEIGSDRPRISPRVSPYRRAARRPYSGGVSAKYDINGEFDKLER